MKKTITRGRDPMTRTPVSAENSAIVLIDHAVGFANLFRSHTVADNVNYAVALAKVAKVYNVPLVVTNGPDEGFSGPIYPQLREVLGDHPVVVRYGAFDAFLEPQFAEAIAATGRRTLVMGGLMTEGCLLQTALTAVDRGYEVYAVLDASAGETTETHQAAVQRMVQAGVIPTTWLSIASEYQVSWANTETVGGYSGMINAHSATFNMMATVAANIQQYAAKVES
jgi:nicotinamidase-related amidase